MDGGCGGAQPQHVALQWHEHNPNPDCCRA